MASKWPLHLMLNEKLNAQRNLVQCCNKYCSNHVHPAWNCRYPSRFSQTLVTNRTTKRSSTAKQNVLRIEVRLYRVFTIVSQFLHFPQTYRKLYSPHDVTVKHFTRRCSYTLYICSGHVRQNHILRDSSFVVPTYLMRVAKSRNTDIFK